MREGVRVRILAFIASLLLVPSILFGCSSYSQSHANTEFYGGEELSPEAIDSIADSIYAAQTEKYPRETDDNGEPVFFWTDGGSVWHYSRACGGLKSSKNIRRGSEAQARAAGKSRPCSVCDEDNE